MPPIIELTQGEGSQKYNIQLDFMKHHMSGMLIVRRMPDNEIRIVASIILWWSRGGTIQG